MAPGETLDLVEIALWLNHRCGKIIDLESLNTNSRKRDKVQRKNQTVSIT